MLPVIFDLATEALPSCVLGQLKIALIFVFGLAGESMLFCVTVGRMKSGEQTGKKMNMI